MTNGRLSILVVDDDADARLVMRAALSKAGYEVRLAESGEEALRQFRASPADLVMLDVEMPGLSGHQVCASLRAEAGPLLPIVMVTGMDDLASVQTAYDCGATDFIAKPVNWALVGHRVRYLFRSHQTRLSLSASEARNAAILDALPDYLFELDIDGRCTDYCAPEGTRLAGRSEEIIGKTIADVLPAAAAEICLSALQTALERGSSSGQQFELPLKNGPAWFELSVSRKTVPEGQTPRFILLARDVTERKDAERRIARLAYFDSLTGLPNRHSFLERVDQEIRHREEHGGKLAVLFMDLDGFKNVNDTLGHTAGDLILQSAAERLRGGLRSSDLLSRPIGSGHDEVELARLGGDEFTALVVGIQRPEDAVTVAQRIGQAMRKAFVLDGRNITLTTSIGIALYPEDGRDGETLLKHADTAMYHAKNSGRDNAQVYSASLTEHIRRRMELDASLRVALDRGEFQLVYQPQIEVASGRVCSVEALIRWNHPERGIVSPLEFIPLAEETGLIERIGSWVLRTACADAVVWNRAGSPMTVAVNLSPLQFRRPGLPKRIMDVLVETGLPPQLLELEITESVLMENTAAVQGMLQALRDQGVRTALDDFGTGYSSLAYLTRMPIDKIKVDRCFVTGLLDGGENAAIVRAVLAMAASLGMSVTAEGVETFPQARALKAMGCYYMQGYFFSMPVSADSVPGLRRRHWALDGQDQPSTVVPLIGRQPRGR